MPIALRCVFLFYNKYHFHRAHGRENKILIVSALTYYNFAKSNELNSDDKAHKIITIIIKRGRICAKVNPLYDLSKKNMYNNNGTTGFKILSFGSPSHEPHQGILFIRLINQHKRSIHHYPWTGKAKYLAWLSQI